MATGTRDADERVLSFRIGERSYAVPASGVREVARRPPVTRVPQGPATLVGLMNFHGTAIPVVRVSAMLGLASAADSDASRIVVYGEDPPVGLLVDSVLDLEVATTKSGKQLDIEHLLTSGFAARPAAQKAALVRQVASGSARPTEDTAAILGFRLADQRFALPLESVAEALAMPSELAILPRADDSVVGMLDWRGAVLPLMSLASLLGLSQSAGRAHVLVMRSGGAMVGLVCGAIDGVLRVPVSAMEAVPAILQRGEGDAEIDSIARVGEQRSLVSVLSPAKLFRNRDIGRALEGASTGATEMQAQAIAATTLQLVVFSLGDDVFGLPLGAVTEIVQLPEALSRVPRAPKFVAGVMNLRGRALPVIDLRLRFQSGAGNASARPRVIVVATEQLQAGFIVDGVSEILRVSEDEVLPAPAMPGDGARVFDRVTVAKQDGAMILIVDPQEMLDRAERDLLSAFKPVEETQVPK